jgi:hypothetical protein
MKEYLTGTENIEIIENILRNLSVLEKAFDRLKRKNWHHENQYPDIIFKIESLLIAIRAWIRSHIAFCGVSAFIWLLGAAVERTGRLIDQLVTECNPQRGKRKEKKSRSERERAQIMDSLCSMVQNMEHRVDSLKPSDTHIGTEIEKALSISFERYLSEPPEMKRREPISKRGRKSCIFPFSDADSYIVLVNDRKKFKDDVVKKLPALGHFWGHKHGCKGEKSYIMKGFRRTPRKTIMTGGEKKEFPIRIVQCTGCKEKFSLLPSFLPREKHFHIDIIGATIRSVCLFCQSIRGAFEITGLTGRKLKSIQTIMNWIKWLGFLHPAEILTRAGVKGSGYFQEDEGFEKEPNLRTYSVAMVDSESMLVWHMDYVDRVDEETLFESFEKFAGKIDFKVCGVTKDKWRASTKALKSVFHGIWIGFCHRHFLKKLWDALSDWRKETGNNNGEIKKIYASVKKILATANSQTMLRIKIDMAEEPAFDHSAIRPVLDALKKNAVHYTVNKRRNGIKRTTSLVDNFLKIVKRKLREAESFRDRNWTAVFLRALANVRNFVPFMSGAKNAHKSPFMLADGSTYDLPWIQVMNVHNAFLFVED